MKKVLALSALLAVTGMLLAGCPKAQEAANAGADAAAGAVDAAKDTTAGAMNSVKDTANNAVAEGNKMLDTGIIKAAITADAALNDPANKINVDVTDKAVLLKGNVKNNDLKKKAGEIATAKVKEAGSALEVKNMLLVK